jgi:hypothetical protein
MVGQRLLSLVLHDFDANMANDVELELGDKDRL